jgi:hypothetical protein
MTQEDTALMERPESSVITVDTKQFEVAFDAYIQLQKAIDARMPDQIMKIGTSMFRKKGYWRAVAKGFRLSLRLDREEFFEHNDDWGYRVIYVAEDPNGAVATGDGTCMASEKSKGRMEATHHNVCSHAHTRAQNRAISNLVGFGEVSADELPVTRKGEPKPANASRSKTSSGGGWDGELLVKSGKYKGQRWADLTAGFLEWALERDGAIKEMAAKEMARRATAEPEPIQGEVVDDDRLPSERRDQGSSDMGPDPEDPRFQ